MAILAAQPARLPVGLRVEELRAVVEARDRVGGALAPVVALEQHEEIVAADVAEKVALRVAHAGQHRRGEFQHFVALPVAVLVVERLELVQVDVARMKAGVALEQAVDVRADRDVAGQERQRIRVARGLDAHLGHRAHEALAGAEPDIAAVVGDHEAVREIALVVAREQQRELLEGRRDVDHQRRIVRELQARFLAEHLAVIRQRETVDEAAAIHERDGPPALDERDRVQVGHPVEQLEHVVAGRVARQRRGGHEHLPGDRAGRPHRARHAGKHRDVRRADRVARGRRDHPRRLRVRPAEQEALHAADAHVAHDDQVAFVLDAFRDQLRAARLREVLHRLHRFELERVARDVVDEETVDLHDVRMQAQPQVHARVRGAVVVERELDAGVAQRRDRRPDVRDVGNRVLLGELDHDALGADARTAEKLAGALAFAGEREDRARAEIEEQLAVAAERRERVEAGECGGPFERDGFAFARGLREQRGGWFEVGAARAADQPLVTDDRPRPEVDDRLEHGGERAIRDQARGAGDSGIGGKRGHGRGQPNRRDARLNGTARGELNEDFVTRWALLVHRAASALGCGWKGRKAGGRQRRPSGPPETRQRLPVLNAPDVAVASPSSCSPLVSRAPQRCASAAHAISWI